MHRTDRPAKEHVRSGVVTNLCSWQSALKSCPVEDVAMANRDELLLVLHERDERRILLIVEFWNELRVCDDTGRTSWETLEPLEREVAECVRRRTGAALLRAESLKQLALLIAGLVDL